MGTKCKLGFHNWDGCKCTSCGKIRDEQHDWKGCKCLKCEKPRDEQHDWSQDCEKCSLCGKTRENKHDWSKDCEKCSVCGKTRGFKQIGDNLVFDERDGKYYETINIGNQEWLAENFAYRPSSGNFWAYDDNQKNISECGYLYDWETAKKVSPKGWHLPTFKDWDILNENLGKECGSVYEKIIYGGGSGFNAIEGGARGVKGNYFGIGESSTFWSATTHDNNRSKCFLIGGGQFLVVNLYGSSPNCCGHSIRLIRDSQPKDTFVKKPNIEWVEITAGSFTMGSPGNEVSRIDDEVPHLVTLSTFKMSKYAISFEQYDIFCDATDRKKPFDQGWGRGKRPVINVSWEDANAFSEWMDCRLPTEAEWEYACRAETTTPFNTGNYLSTLQANYNGNYPYNNNVKGKYYGKTMPVGSFTPNAWDLFDMHGNVWEWCKDWKDDYSKKAQTNPSGPNTGKFPVLRGGSWSSEAKHCRSAARRPGSYWPEACMDDTGFRVVSIK